MAITITKQKPALKKELVQETVAAPEELDFEQLADLYGSLEDQVNALLANPVFTKFEEVKKVLASKLALEVEPEETATIKGAHWVLDVGVAAKNARKVTNIPQVQAFLGAETFAKVAKVNISDLEKYLTPDQLAQVVDDDTGYSNKRKIVCKFAG